MTLDTTIRALVLRVTMVYEYLLLRGVVLDRNRRKAKHLKARQDAELRQIQTSVNTDVELRRLLRRVDSDYNRDRLHDSWTRNLRQMVNKAGAPESPWWTQYMTMATVRTAR